MGRLSGQIADLRHAELHSSGQFVAGDAGSEFLVTGVLFEVALVQLPQQAASGLIGVAGNSWG